MPLYEFKCDNPESPYFEKPMQIIMTFNEYEQKKDTMKCPITNSPMQRVYTGKTGFQFKGSGFFSTDYK